MHEGLNYECNMEGEPPMSLRVLDEVTFRNVSRRSEFWKSMSHRTRDTNTDLFRGRSAKAAVIEEQYFRINHLVHNSIR